MKLTKQFVGRMLSKLMEDVDQTRNLEHDNFGLTHSVVSRPNPEWSVVRTKRERFSTFVHVQGHSQGVAIHPDLLSLKPILFEWEGTHIPHGQLFQLQINPIAQIMTIFLTLIQ